MRIKLAILDRDQTYLNRIVTAFSTKYPDKFEIYSFTDEKNALSAVESNRVEVFIASDFFDIDVSTLPKRCGFAYFVDTADIDTVRDQRAICRFQKADLIYKQILNIHAENAGSFSGLKLGDDSTKVIVFSSPNGGVGTSAMAAACATHFAALRKKALYLNLEKYGSSDLFFSAEGMFDMSDIIYSLKSKKVNLSLKMESCIKQDKCGVYFYSPSKIALDMLELSTEDIIRLISELKYTGSYDYIIVDMDFSMSKEYLKVYKQAHAVVWIGDGSDISNTKIERAYNALSITEKNADAPITNRLCLIYNKFSNKTGITIGDIGLRSIGGAPRYEHVTSKQVVTQLSSMNVFEKII